MGTAGLTDLGWPGAIVGQPAKSPGRARGPSQPDARTGDLLWKPGLAWKQPRGECTDVRAIYRPGAPGSRPGPRRGPDAQPQLHRYRAHPARADPRGRGRRREGPRAARDPG